MRKISLLFIPLLILLSCKKSDTLVSPVAEELDTSEAFKDIVFSDVKNTNNFILNDHTSINYLGFVTESKSVDDQSFNPLVGVGLANTGFLLTDSKGGVIKETVLKNAVLSEYRNTVNVLIKNTSKSLLPEISFKIYASTDIVNSNKTNITLVLNSVYYYLDLNQVTNDHFQLSPNVKMDEIKAKGSYLSRIGYGQKHIIGISTDQNPKIVLTYLKAYLNDLLYNGGKKSEELSKGLNIPGDKFSVMGGDTDMDLLFRENKEKIKLIIKNSFEARSINSSFAGIEFEFKNFNKLD